MFQVYLINFSLLFAFTILVYWPKQYFKRNPLKKHFSKNAYNVFVGLKYGVVGTLLGYISLDPLGGALYNSKIIFVLFSGLIGGPIAIFVSGFSMTLGRLLLFPTSDITLLMTLNFFILLLILTYVAKQNRVRFDNIDKFLYFSLGEIAIVLLFYYNFSFTALTYIFSMFAFTVFTFWSIYWVIAESQASSDKAKQAMALKQIDYLTQLPNNYAIEAKMSAAIIQAASFSYLHIDIDEFKQLNNKYGYIIGDRVLEEFAQLIKGYAKGKDVFIGRLSGKEFCYVIKDAPPAIALYEANEIRNLIENHSFGHRYGHDLNITISIGISSMPENGTSLEEIYAAADKALQASKKTSKNQVYHFNQFKKDIEYSHL